MYNYIDVKKRLLNFVFDVSDVTEKDVRTNYVRDLLSNNTKYNTGYIYVFRPRLRLHLKKRREHEGQFLKPL